jgi:hypothetical protein
MQFAFVRAVRARLSIEAANYTVRLLLAVAHKGPITLMNCGFVNWIRLFVSQSEKNNNGK